MAEAISLANLFDANYQQHPSYAMCAARSVRARCDLFAVKQSGEDIGFCAVRVKELPMLGGGLAYVHQGPVVAAAADAGEDAASRWNACVDALVAHYAAGKRMVLRIEPPLCRDRARAGVYASSLHDRGFVQMQRARPQTILVDLAPTLSDIRSALNQKWRNQLSYAERSGLRVTRSHDPADFDRFAPLLAELQSGKGFTSARGASFFKAVAAGAKPDAPISIHLAWHGDAVVAGHVGAYTGKTAVYLLGASNSEGRATRAAYLLQWQAIEYAKSVGADTYDLGGIDQLANPGVFHFKSGMGGQVYEALPAFDLAGGGFSAALVNAADRFRTWFKTRK